jgi:hypothetical protein
MAAKLPRKGDSSKPKPTVDLEELLKKLVLKDKELPREEFVNLHEGTQCMAVSKVHTMKRFGNLPFFQRMDMVMLPVR